MVNNTNNTKELIQLWLLVMALIIGLFLAVSISTPAHASMTKGTAKELCSFGLVAFCK